MKTSKKILLLAATAVLVLGGGFWVYQSGQPGSPTIANPLPAPGTPLAGDVMQAASSGAPLPASDSSPVAASAGSRTAPILGEEKLREKTLEFVRERFGVPPNVKLTADGFRPSAHPDFLQITITSDNGKEKHNNHALVTKDQKLLVIGSLVDVKSDAKREIVENLRTQFKIPATTNVTATDFRPSSFANLLATTVTLDDGKQQPQVQEFFMTKDGRSLVVGSIYNMAVDPRLHALRTINTANQPSLGPSTAPVTIVEYSDLQCPMCSRMHDFLENDILKKYAGKIQVVFKEFPIPSIHDWTLTASVANQCVYQISPPTYVPYRSLIFKNQSSINATNVRDLMLSYGDQLGVDRLRLAACIDSKASLPRVEANFREGQSVGVQSTPTSFINGKMIIGLPSIDAFYKTVDEALQTSK